MGENSEQYILTDYHKWADLKHTLNSNSKRQFFRESKIWWCAFGRNIGDEQNGKNKYYERPVLIVKKFNKNLFIGVAMTSKVKHGRYYFQCHFLGKPSTVILSQFRLYDSKRLLRRLSWLKKSHLYQVKKMIRELI
jgi:mRNA interferase MazF